MSDFAILLVVILVVLVIWRGPAVLPGLGRALGRGIRDLRSAVRRRDEDDGGHS